MSYRGKQDALTEEHRKARKIVAELEALLGAFAAPEKPLLSLDAETQDPKEETTK